MITKLFGRKRGASAQPAAPFTEHSFVTRDGVTLYYRDYAPVEADRDRAAVICLAGLTRNCRDFEELAPAVAGLGRRVITPDNRGRGRSEADPNPHRYVPATYAHDVIELLEALGVPRAVFIGTSMGALMTMLIARERSDLVGAAVLNDIGPVVDPDGLARIEAYLSAGLPSFASWEEAASAFNEVGRAAFPKQTDDAFWLTFAKRVMREAEPGRIVLDYDPAISTTAQADLLVPPGLWSGFDALADKPALVIRGAVSDLLTPQIAAEMRARKPDLDYAEVPDIGHAPFMTEPAAWAAVSAFLGRVD